MAQKPKPDRVDVVIIEAGASGATRGEGSHRARIARGGAGAWAVAHARKLRGAMS